MAGSVGKFSPFVSAKVGWTGSSSSSIHSYDLNKELEADTGDNLHFASN